MSAIERSASDKMVSDAFESKQRPRVEVVCVMDLTLASSSLYQRKIAYEEIQEACDAANASLHLILFQKLDFGEMSAVEKFHGADVAIIDLSIQEQQNSLLYLLGVRESFGMKQNILLFNEYSTEGALQLRLSCSNYSLISYRVNENKQCIVTEPNVINMLNNGNIIQSSETKILLHTKLTKILQEIEIQTKAHMKEKFLSDLRKARDDHTGDKLREALHNLRKRLDDPNLMSIETAYNMFLSFREIQDYDAMIKLFTDLQSVPHLKLTSNATLLYFYAFALNRRNLEGDREKAIKFITMALEQTDGHVPDIVCLCGRIYKDKFVESGYSDVDSLKNAIKWYRKGFEVQPNEYAGINLATLLVIDGANFAASEELQRIGMVLSNLIGRKGSLTSLQDYWDVATFFEISVLAENYSKAIQASECMFKLKPPNWYLKSTIGNIRLINRFRKKPEDSERSPEEHIFNFWMEYFIDATEEEISVIKFPILVLEPTKTYQPSYVTVNIDIDEKSVQITNVCLECMKKMDCRRPHNWLIEASSIKGVSLYKRDERCLFLYVHLNSDDFQMFFPSEALRARFHQLVVEMTGDQGLIADLGAQHDNEPLQYEYDLDDQRRPIVLGAGTYGKVYAARDKRTQIELAIKEIPVKNEGEVQPLHEEIKLHSQLRHRNIVQYLGSMYENRTFKIFMERVPGGSLSQLLRSKWGPLKENESTMAYYTKQMLQGLKYLHDQKIVHRDIKGDNVLVNTYSGIIKISDFGASKRLAGLNPNTETFTGTFQYMAPEVIDQGQRGYGAPADIWSLGCTVVEMATGRTPVIDGISGPEIIFKVGFHKEHPEIPQSLSEKAKEFILRCFDPNPDTRATAAELLEHPFLAENHGHGTRKKKTMPMSSSPTPHKQSHLDFNRSISVPAESHLPRDDRNTDSRNRFASADDTSNFSPYFHSSEDAPYARRNSGSIMSPPIESASTTPRDGDTGGFYLLKKDSERRATLVQVLNDDSHLMCDTWLHLLQQNIQGLLLTSDHLHQLLAGIRDFIPEQDRAPLAQAIAYVKEDLEFDGINQIQLALLLAQDAVNRVLRCHNIKPHWMFALDSLVRGAVQAAITILSPELGENLAGDSRRDSRELSPPDNRPGVDPSTTSAISTLASIQSAIHIPHHHDLHNHQHLRPDSPVMAENEEDEICQLRRKYDKIRTENISLWQKLLSAENQINFLLKNQLNEKQKQMEMLISSNRNLSLPNGSQSENSPPIEPETVPKLPNIVIGGDSSNGDQGLVTWLKSHKHDQEHANEKGFNS
ncbi:mitogen-activated protein kinase kinase kinase 15 isoform X2 [Tetranychus urticae]|uniref:mitogen-activated protein kinase kinase kinase 15 isoform X2 n=1 Tax=Tetranychus urticae TaxID=32264 RepID=UPI00077BAF2B|nr:mitogen-activated protein kinase kinase kinase 15 isoform X2 [Tetranychus urticae]